SLLEVQEVKSPRGNIHIETLQLQLAAITLELSAAEHILQLPGSPGQFVPGQLHTRLRWVLQEVHDNYITHLILTPAPCYQVQVATVVRPTCTLAQLPFTPTQSRILDRCQQFLVERP